MTTEVWNPRGLSSGTPVWHVDTGPECTGIILRIYEERDGWLDSRGVWIADVMWMSNCELCSGETTDHSIEYLRKVGEVDEDD